jgi:N-acetylmuramoyl-L-alanine amidase
MLDVAMFCLSLAIYHESRGETSLGQEWVGHVILNRTKDPRWGGNTCEVIRDKSQFSFTMEQPVDDKAWQLAQTIAYRISYNEDITGGSLWYHRCDIKKQHWTTNLHMIIVGNHCFWRE